MRGGWRAWLFVLAAAGCHGVAKPPVRPPEPTVAPAASELPFTNPIVPVLDGHDLQKLPPRMVMGLEGKTFRRVRESDCLLLAASNTSTANLLEQENQIPSREKTCDSAKAKLRQNLRYHTALELRNQAAADALERFVQLAELEARTDLLRKSFPIVDGLIAKTQAAKAASVQFPLDLADLNRQRSQLEAQLEQAELGSQLLNLDLKRRLGLPALPAEERLWPVGDFAIDPTPFDLETAVNAAMADRPELRGLRTFHRELTVDTLPDARDFLRAVNPLIGLGSSQSEPRLPWLLEHWLRRSSRPNAATQAELEVRKKQLLDFITDQERTVADETRAAVLSANSQRIRATLARDRLLGWEEKLAEAEKKSDADQPGAKFLVPQTQLEVLKARSEVAAEVAAWHQARIKVKAAQGWLAWETVPKGTER